MVSILEAFVVSFAIDAAKFKKGSEEVQDTSKRTKDVAQKTFGAIEEAGKKTAKGVRSISMELLGLFLTFQGAGSITGFIGNMVMGTAAADRMGQTIGMTTGKVLAWQRAMKDVGGQAGDADSSLQAMESLKQEWAQFGIRGPRAQILQSMGVNAQDLEKSDPGSLLMKLASAQRPWGNERYANQLQQLGLSQNMIYFLMQGGDQVKKTITSYERNSKELEKQAKEAEKLQKSLSELNDSITKALVPALNNLVPLLTRIVEWINSLFGGGEPKQPKKPGTIFEDPFGLMTIRREGEEAAEGAAKAAGARRGGAMPKGVDGIMKYFMGKGMSLDDALGIRAGIMAEGGTATAVNPKSGAFGIGQWLGPRKRELFKRYGRQPTLQNQLDFMWWELNGGDHGGKSVLNAKGIWPTLQAYITNFMRPQGKNWEHRKDWKGDMDRAAKFLRGWSAQQTTNIGTINIHTRATDAKGIARDMRGALKQRSTIVHADQRVRP